MSKINPYFLATGLIFLICGYAYAGGSIEFLGNFSGGNVGAPVVFTGDNANGTGTVRIRPSDEDTQLVLCEASNNASPEVCSSLHHINSSSTVSFVEMTGNAYLDSSGNYQRYNTNMGYGSLYSQVGTVNTSNVIGGTLWSTNGTVSGNWSIQVTGAGTSTFSTGTVGTVTNDFRGPITNGGSATCDGINAGTLCFNDINVTLATTNAGSFVGHYIRNGSATGTAGFALLDSSNNNRSQYTYVNASYTDADIADKTVIYSVGGKVHGMYQDSDQGVTTLTTEFMDNVGATGVRQLGIYGGGTITYPQTQTVTCADNGGGTNATQNLDPQAHTITILNNDATGCDVTMQETSAILGAVAVICVDPASTATNVNLADVANVFNGAAPALSQGDCITIRYFDAANDLWLQTGASNN